MEQLQENKEEAEDVPDVNKTRSRKYEEILLMSIKKKVDRRLKFSKIGNYEPSYPKNL